MYLISLMDLHPDIFDEIRVTSELDRDTIVNTIIRKAATYDMLHHAYPLVKHIINIWFDSHFSQFDRLAKAADTEYDLIQNYDRTREYSRKVARDETQTDSTTDTNTVSAYNQSGYSPESQTTGEGESGRQGNEDETILEREYGDLSVATASSKIKEEMDLRSNPRYNVYEVIAEMWISDMCLRLYNGGAYYGY